MSIMPVKEMTQEQLSLIFDAKKINHKELINNFIDIIKKRPVFR